MPPAARPGSRRCPPGRLQRAGHRAGELFVLLRRVRRRRPPGRRPVLGHGEHGLQVGAAIAVIAQDAWTGIRYPRAIWDDQLGCWVSDAQVGETEYTAFTSSKKGQAITARLIVRRVRDLTKQADAGQDELFPVWRYHAVFTDSPVELVQAEAQHRDHAIVEQVFTDWTDGPLAHLRGLPGQRGLAGLRADRAQPAACRRVPGQPGLRQGPRRNHPPRPDRRRRPHRPARPRAHHAAPAEAWHREHEWMTPVHCRLRPDPDSGLTSPYPVTALSRPPGRPAAAPETRKPGHAARPVSGRKPTPISAAKITSNQSPARARSPLKSGRWIEAKWHVRMLGHSQWRARREAE
jgi:hypothetical protein